MGFLRTLVFPDGHEMNLLVRRSLGNGSSICPPFVISRDGDRDSAGRHAVRNGSGRSSGRGGDAATPQPDGKPDLGRMGRRRRRGHPDIDEKGNIEIFPSRRCGPAGRVHWCTISRWTRIPARMDEPAAVQA
jgi:hypothetical protein